MKNYDSRIVFWLGPCTLVPYINYIYMYIPFHRRSFIVYSLYRYINFFAFLFRCCALDIKYFLRSFSKLKLINTIMRSVMKQARPVWSFFRSKWLDLPLLIQFPAIDSNVVLLSYLIHVLGSAHEKSEVYTGHLRPFYTGDFCCDLSPFDACG